MPLTTREECQDKQKVWTELQNSYTQQRSWTQNDFVWVCPDMTALEKIRPPYKVSMTTQMSSPRPGDTGDWRRVEIEGSSTSLKRGAPP